MRLIDADATLDLLKSLGSRDYRRSKGTIAEAEKMLMHDEYTPTIDATPVRHGQWITTELDALKCSACGGVEDVWWADKGTCYCPHCGAKMDEVSE